MMMMIEYTLEHSNEVLVKVHDPAICAGQSCTIHNLSDHHMRTFPQHWRSDRMFMERICSHGIGHPDPDELPGNSIHGCDGCCVIESDLEMNHMIQKRITSRIEDVVLWLKSCKCQQYNCGHKQAVNEIEQLRQLGDTLAVAYRTLGGLDAAYDSALRSWEEARNGK